MGVLQLRQCGGEFFAGQRAGDAHQTLCDESWAVAQAGGAE
jgi:hypothetical protein